MSNQKFSDFTNASSLSDSDIIVGLQGGANIQTLISVIRSTLGIPVATVIPYAGPSAPTGWLLCDGSIVSRTTYSALFAIVGETFGAGDGSTTFVLPNLIDYVPAGVGGTLGSTIGVTVGALTVTLTENQLASHTHHYSSPDAIVTVAAGADQAVVSAILGADTIATGGNLSHENVQPTILLNYIIKI